jgi:hypothetical protein
MVRGDQGKTGKIFHRVLQIPHCCCVLEYIRNGIAKKLENFASKNTREFILRHPVYQLIQLKNSNEIDPQNGLHTGTHAMEQRNKLTWPDWQKERPQRGNQMEIAIYSTNKST